MQLNLWRRLPRNCLVRKQKAARKKIPEQPANIPKAKPQLPPDAHLGIWFAALCMRQIKEQRAQRTPRTPTENSAVRRTARFPL
jgi:hypothetical protein